MSNKKNQKQAANFGTEYRSTQAEVKAKRLARLSSRQRKAGYEALLLDGVTDSATTRVELASGLAGAMRDVPLKLSGAMRAVEERARVMGIDDSTKLGDMPTNSINDKTKTNSSEVNQDEESLVPAIRVRPLSDEVAAGNIPDTVPSTVSGVPAEHEPELDQAPSLVVPAIELVSGMQNKDITEEEVQKMRELVTRAGEDLDDLIAKYQAETDPMKADKLWDRLERAHKQYKELVADFNLKNSALSGLIGTPLFGEMKSEVKIVKANVRSEGQLRVEDADYLHIPPTSTENKAAARAAKEAAKTQRKCDIATLEKATKEIPTWFSPINGSDGPSREKQWGKLLKSFRDESRKYSKHERGDALTGSYKIACELERKWRGRDNFDSLTVVDKEDYQKDMDRLLHGHDGFAWKVLGSSKIDARELSVSELYHVISRAEFKNTLRESKGRELGGLASMLVTAPSDLYYTSMALLTSLFPGADSLYWFIDGSNRQRTIDSLSHRTAKGLGIPMHAEYTIAA